MALTVDAIRTGHLNGYLGRADGSTKPWTDAACNTAIGEAIQELWPMLGVYMNATAASNENSPVYTIPTGMKRVSRIVLEYTNGGRVFHVEQVASWRYDSPTTVVCQPNIRTNSAVVLRFYGWKPYAIDATDLPDEFATAVAMKAAADCYGQLLGQLGNIEDQMALDSGKVVTHQDAVAISAYWQRKFEDRSRILPGQVSYAPRAAYRGSM